MSVVPTDSSGPAVDVAVVADEGEDGMLSLLRCTYTPSAAGELEVSVVVEGSAVKNTPATVAVTAAADGSKSWAEGPGLTTASRGEEASFVVHPLAADGGPVVGPVECVVQCLPAAAAHCASACDQEVCGGSFGAVLQKCS